jgi:hypothetical protein
MDIPIQMARKAPQTMRMMFLIRFELGIVGGGGEEKLKVESRKLKAECPVSFSEL